MATIGSMCEEKLSPKQLLQPELESINENDLQNEKLNDTTNTKVDGREDNKSETDAVLDEIAAKVCHALDLREDDDHVDHEKCVNTIKSQGETIKRLLHQLQIMFEEYTSMNNEREYYEELNEALFRCLELNEAEEVDSEEDDFKNDNGGIKEKEGETEIKHTDADVTPTSTTTPSIEKSDDTTHMDVEMPTENKAKGEATSHQNEQEINEDEETAAKAPRKMKMTRSELQNINKVLLREIFELRHQRDVLKENFRDYLNSEDLSQTSEYDTATDDDHVCVCVQCKPVRSQDSQDDNDEGSQDDIGDGSQSEEYQVDQESEVKIADESDTD